MKKNMGTIDRILRILLAVVAGALSFTGRLTGTAAVITGIFAVIFLVTSSVGFCPAYTPFGNSTLKKGGAHEVGHRHGDEAHGGAH
jgi:uncharacterized membrane protein YtjA (UPF0391 family)